MKSSKTSTSSGSALDDILSDRAALEVPSDDEWSDDGKHLMGNIKNIA